MTRIARLVAGALSVMVLLLSAAGVASAYNPILRCDQVTVKTDSTTCVDCAQAPDASICKTTTSNPVYGSDSVLTKVTNVIAVVGGVVAVFVIVIAGGRFVFSGGDSQKVTTARNAILYAVIGLVVIVIGRSVILFVISKVS